jgi:TetR/AcrR family transcriptional regulator, lmrAB and yxaGH operons repressor
MPRISTARERMVVAATRLFQRRGYHGTGVAEILSESSAPKGSFYHHFPDGKEELAAVAVAAAGLEIGRLIDSCFADATSFADGAKRAADAIGEWFEGTGYSEGCPITAVHLEMTPRSGRLADATAQVFADWCSRVAVHAVRLGVVPDRAADDSALGLVLALEGAWVLSRAQRSRRPFMLAATMAATLAVSG